MSETKAMPLQLVIVTDLMGGLLAIAPGALGWATSFVALRSTWGSDFAFFAVAVATPLIAALTMIAVIAVTRLALPPMRKGVYRAGLNRGMLAWYCAMALNRASKVSGLHSLIHSSNLLRFLHYRALGARIAYDVQMAIDVTLVDTPLIEIGSGAVIADEVTISCHTFVGDRLVLKPVKIGSGAFVGARTLIGPGAKLGPDAWIGAGNLVAAALIEPGQKIPSFAWERGKPASTPADAGPSSTAASRPD